MTDLPMQPLVQPAADADASAASGRLVDDMGAQRAAQALALALLGGLAAQLLFFGQHVGVNVVLWVTLVLAAALVVRRPTARLDRLDLWLPVAAIAFAAFIALRDDPTLAVFNLLASAALTLAAVVALGGLALMRRAASVVGRIGVAAATVTFIGAASLASGIRPLSEAVAGRGNPTLRSVAHGVLLAVPLLVVFIVLFRAADAVFDAHVGRIVGGALDWPDLLARTLFALLAGWLFAGALVCTWLARAPAGETAATDEARWRVGSVEAVVVLLLLDALFVAFVVVQAAYLFGGLDSLAVSGLTYAEYARRGFFELIAVALLVGVVLLSLGYLVPVRRPALRGAAIVLAVLTAVILVSAAYRLALYQGAYGWTELRFYALVAIGWLAACLGGAVVSLARDRLAWLPRVVLGAGLAAAIVANLVGPQAFVTAQNLERAIDPRLVPAGGHTGLDVFYLRWLGADSVPVLVAARDRLPASDASAVDRLLRTRAAELRAEAAVAGWPSWNLGRHRALEALRQAGY